MSATVLIGQAPTNLGPLTTTFTPPAACTVAVGAGSGGLAGLLGGGGDEDVAYLAQGCSRGKAFDATSCWPESSKGAEEGEAPLSGWGYYSPGLHCPVGYATACSATGGSGGGSGWPVQFKLRDGETAAGCCPSGYGCANINGQTCTMIATSTTVPTVTCDGSKSGDFAFMTLPDAKASITALSLFAPMIQINWQSSDRPKPTPTGSSSTNATATSSPSSSSDSGTQTIDTGAGSAADETLILDGDPQTTGNTNFDMPSMSPTASLQAENESSSSGDSGPLSSGARVAIGVAGSVAVLLMLVVALFYWWRRHKNQREEQEMDRLYGVKNTMSAGGDFTGSEEIPGWYRGQRLGTPTAAAAGRDPFGGFEVGGGGGGGGGGFGGVRELERPAPAVPYYRPYRPA